MVQFSWDQKSYILNGERRFLVSGEFHYFRVPKEDWEKRLILFKEAGGNCVATYIPWILHEPAEGDIRFGDIPQRDLEGFLQLCKSLGLLVICRPGPYQYSELKYDGLPGWLCENYPEVLARDMEGNIFRGSSISYLHPLFLEKVKVWFDVVCPMVAKYMLSNDGPVAMVQIDNELMGIHEWFGSWDYNQNTMGFGSENGRYPMFLQQRYSTIDKLNSAYGSDYKRFDEALPIHQRDFGADRENRWKKDYQDFYFSTVAEYVSLLLRWIRALGIDCQIVHNSANPYMNAYFLEMVKSLGKEVLLGSDHYYNLDQDWDQNNPTPQYAIKIYYSNEMLRLMGYPSTIFELPGGSFSEWPPITKEDLLCCYMTNTALGMKGLNYYIFTGGPNPEGVSLFGDVYDYGASIGAYGEIRPTYSVQKQYGEFLNEHSWLAGATKAADFYIGLDWEQSRSRHYSVGYSRSSFSNTEAWSFMQKGLMTTAFCASYSCNMIDLTKPETRADTGKPLFVPTSSCMSAVIQETLVEYIKNGGKLLLTPVIPFLDEDSNPCTILSDFLGAGGSSRFEKVSPVVTVGDVHNILMNGTLWMNATRPEGARCIASVEGTETEIGWKKEYAGGGQVIWLGFQWKHGKHEHTSMLQYLLSQLGCESPLLRCSNPNVWASLRSDGTRHMIFVMNLLSAPMQTEIAVRLKNGGYRQEAVVQLKPMEVKTLELEEESSNV